jgi:hypothetical protein
VGEQRRRAGREGGEGTSLVSSGPSLVGVSGAMRARDVSRPTDDDVLAAERLVQVSRRPPRSQWRAQSGKGGRSPERS